jgi:hypothetical protein
MARREGTRRFAAKVRGATACEGEGGADRSGKGFKGLAGGLQPACKGFAEAGGGVNMDGGGNGAQSGQGRARTAKSAGSHTRQRAKTSRGGDTARKALWWCRRCASHVSIPPCKRFFP